MHRDMYRILHRPAAAVVVIVAAGVLVVGRSPAIAATAHTPTTPTKTVTLITGDRVMVGDARRGAIVVRPGNGRERVNFVTERARGHTYVLPSDALPLLAGGSLDRRLFDISALLALGYDDGTSVDTPLIVQYAKGGTAASARSRMSAHATVGGDLAAARGFALRAHKRDGVGFWSTMTATAGGRLALATGIERVWLDGKRRIDLDQSVPQIGAPAVWTAGDSGQGVTVAVLDTGVDATHPDLAGRIVAERSFTDDPTIDDQVGHGTHVASIIAGTGSASSGRYRGVAPGASLAIGKVCVDTGCPESAILAGMQWAAVDEHAKVVNMSFGGDDTLDIDPLEDAVNTLTAQQGTLFVIAAGNAGPTAQTVSSPASADAALAVAAVDKSDQLAQFSSRGPRIGDGAIKPDLAAPGVDIVAARAAGTGLGAPVGDSYTQLSGTSMAAPHVAGAAALLAQHHPDWGPDVLKASLMNAATPLAGADVYSAGSGRVDAARAFAQQIVAQPPSLSLGTQLWPHGDDKPVARAVTLHNYGPSPATVAVSFAITGPSGDPAPPGMFTASPSVLTIPAGASAPVTITATTGTSDPVGDYVGTVIARVGDAAIATIPAAIEVEPERYNLTLQHLDDSGRSATGYFTMLLRTDVYDELYLPETTGPVTLRLPKAPYILTSLIFSDPTSVDPRQALFTDPTLMVDHDQAIDLDARQARAPRFQTPEYAVPMVTNVGFDAQTGWGPYSWQLETSAGSAISTRQVGPAAPADRFVGRVEATLARPGARGDFGSSPYRYNVAWYPGGALPTGFVGTVRRGDLATVVQTYVPSVPGWPANAFTEPQPTGKDWLAPGWLYNSTAFSVPSQRTDYYLAAGVTWRDDVSQYDPDTWTTFDQWASSPVAYQAGQTYQVTWNAAVIGPSTLGTPVARWGDDFAIVIPMFSDGTSGHFGGSPYEDASTVLYRNGGEVARTDSAGYLWSDVPSGSATYRLTVDAQREYADVSTAISAQWTFTSDESDASVPIMAVRFSPTLSYANSAPAGRLFTVPVQVEGGADGVRKLLVQVSYDDGGTWQPALVKGSGSRWVLTVLHPSGAGQVSLRAQATDGHGNTVTQTIIRAYHIG